MVVNEELEGNLEGTIVANCKNFSAFVWLRF
jgi:hypothetical protein